MVVTFCFTVIPLVLLVSGLSEGDYSSNQHRTGYACEGSSLTLSCEDPYHINLIRANFGRFSISTCNTQGNLEWSVNCASPGSFINIKQNCNHKNRCLLPASSAFFGDPCPGTYKYLEVHYECVPKTSDPGSSDVRSMVDDIWSGSSPQSSEQISKPKIISPPPIIKPNIVPRTSSPTVSPSPSNIYINNNDNDDNNDDNVNVNVNVNENENENENENDTIYVPHPHPYPTETPTVPSGDLYYGNPENEDTICILLILGSSLNSMILLIALVTLVSVHSIQTKESALIHKNVTINLLLDHLVLLLILGTYFSPNYFNSNLFNLVTSIPSSSVYLINNTSTLRSLGLLVALYHYFLLVHFVWILFDLVELHFRLTRKQFADQSLVFSPSGSVATVNAASAVTTTSVLTGNINPVKLRRYFYITSYSVPLVVILLISWSTSSQTLPMFANLCSLEARSHLASFVIASSIILTGLGLILLLVTYSRIGLQATADAAASAASPSVPAGSFVYPPGFMTSADKFALDLMLNRKLKISLFLRFSLNLLAALNCALGVVYLTYKVSTIGYLFALTNVSLGLFVFSYYCLTKENIRARFSLICSYAVRYAMCLKDDPKTDYLNNHGNPHHHHHNHSNVIHHLPLNSGLNDGLSRGIVVGAYNKNPSIPNLTGNPAQLTKPIIGSSTSMGALSSVARDYATSKHYLVSDAATTESGSDYGCRRLTAAATAVAAANNAPHLITHEATPNHFYHLYNPKQPCNPYSCHHMIEHVYECIDDEPYVAKVILPAGSVAASATLGNYRLHSMAAASAAAHHGHHLHHLHFQQTLPNHYLGYHNLESLHNSGSQFDVTRSAVNPGSSVNFSNDRAASLGISVGGGSLQRCLVSTSLSAKKAEPPITSTMPVTTTSSTLTTEHILTPL